MLKLRNKFIMPPLKLGYSDNSGIVTKKHLDFYEIRSKHIGAITVEPLFIAKGLREIPTQLGIDNDEKIAGLKKLTDLIHLNKAKVIAHLNHPGRMVNPKIPENYFWSATDKPCSNGGAVPEQMNKKMMHSVIELFVTSAKRAVQTGFDIIELQFGHGYLLAQFLSPEVNDRNDEYGGSFENRAKFPLEILKAVKNSVNIPIIVRISADEMYPSGLHIDEMIKFTSLLEAYNIDAIHVSAGSVCSTPPWFFQHMFIPKGKTWELAGKIKEHTNLPVIFVGRINSATDINLTQKKYNADYIAVGRALVADPDFIGKVLNKVEGNIRPCLACAEGCLGGVKQGKGLGCVVNPLVNTGFSNVEKSKVLKWFAVIGGGLSGMEAAITLKERGYKVDLYEKNKLGGQFNLAFLPPHKENLKEIVDYFVNELKEHRVNVIKKEAVISDFEKSKYDGIIMATGALPAVAPIKGLNEFYWTEFLEDDQLPKNKKILIVGGGLIGLEIASKLVDNNNKVIIVEMFDTIARGMEMIEKAMTIKKLKTKNVEIFTSYEIIEVNGDKVIIKGKHEQETICNINKIVIAVGMRSYLPFKYKGKTPVYIVGDAKKPGKAQDAIHGAYQLAMNL